MPTKMIAGSILPLQAQGDSVTLKFHGSGVTQEIVLTRDQAAALRDQLDSYLRLSREDD